MLYLYIIQYNAIMMHTNPAPNNRNSEPVLFKISIGFRKQMRIKIPKHISTGPRVHSQAFNPVK